MNSTNTILTGILFFNYDNKAWDKENNISYCIYILN